MSKRGRPNRHERRKQRRLVKRKKADQGERAGYEGENILEKALKLVVASGPPFAGYHRSLRMGENDRMGIDALLFLGKKIVGRTPEGEPAIEKRSRMRGDCLTIPLQIKNSVSPRPKRRGPWNHFKTPVDRHYEQYPHIYAMDARRYRTPEKLARHIINLTRRLLNNLKIPVP